MIRLSKRLAGAAVALMVAGSASAQSTDAGTGARLGQAAFECAALAAAGDDELRVLAAPLAQLGYDSYQRVIPQALSEMRAGDVGPQGPFLTTVSTDFMIGAKYAQANRTVSDFLEAEVPINGAASAESVLASRAFIAGSEFSRRNCGLIGR